MKNIELDEFDPTPYVFNHLLSVLFLILTFELVQRTHKAAE